MSNKISRKIRLKIYDLSLKLHKNKGLNPYEIARIINKKFRVNFCVRTIYGWVNQGWVPLQPEPPRGLLYDLYSGEKLSMGQIAKRLEIGKTSVKRYLQKYEIKIRNSKEGQKLRLKLDGKFGGYIKDKLTKKQKQFLIGTLLGDGTSSLGRRNTNARLKIQHTDKDKDYLEFKHSVLKNFVTGKIIKETNLNRKTKKYYSSLLFITTTHPEFTKFHKLFYRRKKKVVTAEVLRKLTPFGLAVWIMDDGYYNREHKFIDLYTMNYTYKEHSIMQNWFRDKYGIFPKINYHKQVDKYYLRFNLLDTQKLVKIIQPYIINSMKRKIGLEIQKAISPFFEVCQLR